MIHPGGMTDNSPTFQRWGRPSSTALSPEGTVVHDSSVVPSGLNHLGRPLPNVGLLSRVPPGQVLSSCASQNAFSMKLLFAFALFPCCLFAAEPVRQTPPPQSFVIGLSPFLEKNVKEDVYRNVIRLLVEDLPLNSTLAVYDAFDLKTVTSVTLPNARVFASPKTRANQFAGAVRDLKTFLVSD